MHVLCSCDKILAMAKACCSDSLWYMYVYFDFFAHTQYAHTHSVMDAMSFPYKLETTKVFMPRRDRDGNELPGGDMKCAIVSKITMLPKELARKLC